MEMVDILLQFWLDHIPYNTIQQLASQKGLYPFESGFNANIKTNNLYSIPGHRQLAK